MGIINMSCRKGTKLSFGNNKERMNMEIDIILRYVSELAKPKKYEAEQRSFN